MTQGCTLGRYTYSNYASHRLRPRGFDESGGKPMKRLYALLSLIAVVALLAVPAVARADEQPPPTPAEQTAPAAEPDGWTWDEQSQPAPDGWTWDEGAITDGWTWDEA
jgi:hypothetical protein